MAAKSIGSLFVNLVANTTKFDKGLKKSQGRLKRFGSSVKALGVKVLTFGSILTGVAIGGFIAFAKGQLEVIDKLAKTAHSLGITTEALGGLQHAAELSGVSNDQLSTALKRMEKTISDASVGLSTAKRALAQLGLSVEQFRGLKPEEQFGLIGDALQSVAEQSDKARIAQDIFGRSGIMLINTLKGGSQGLRDMAADAKALGLTFTDEEAKKVEEFNDQMARLKGLVGGLGRRFVIDVAPAAAEAIEGLVLLVQQWNKLKGESAEARDWLKHQFNWTYHGLGYAYDKATPFWNQLFGGIDSSKEPTAFNKYRKYMKLGIGGASETSWSHSTGSGASQTGWGPRAGNVSAGQGASQTEWGKAQLSVLKDIESNTRMDQKEVTVKVALP